MSIPWVLQPPSTCGCMTGCYNPKYAPSITYVYTGDAIPMGKLNPAAIEASFFGISYLPESVLKQSTKQQAWENHRGRIRQILGY